MSDLAINIRILFWHFQVTFNRKLRFGFNRYIWKEERILGFLIPIEIHDFDLRSLRKPKAAR